MIGWHLIHKTEAGAVGGIIVETEAYTRFDPASHTYRGQTPRNAAMFQAPGTIYIYFTYGMHYCLNIVAGDHSGEAVLIRALEPVIGVDLMQKNRKTVDIHKLCNGPAKLVQALGIDPSFNGSHLNDRQIMLLPAEQRRDIAESPRIGIKKAIDQPWRFFDKNSGFISRRSLS